VSGRLEQLDDGAAALQPLAGGLPPDIAWRYLRIVTDEVMPRL
jgi:hypothetical protein